MIETSMLLTLSLLATLVSAPTPDVAVSAPIYIDAPANQTPVAIASDARNFLTVWLDERPAGGLYAARVSPGAFVFEHAGIRVATHAEAAAAFWNGSRYVILWFDGNAIFSRTLEADGTLSNTTRTIVTSVSAGSHFAAFNGTRIVAVYRRGDAIQSAELDRDGVPGTHDSAVPGAPSSTPVIATSGNDLLVEWIGASGIGSARIVNGATAATAQPPIAADSAITNLVIASDGTSALAVYRQQSQLFARRGDAAPLLIATGTSPDVVFDGTNYIVLFSTGDAIRMTRIDRDGHALDAQPSVIAGGAHGAEYASPVVTWTGDLWFAWSDDRISPQTRNFDVIGRPSDGIDTLISTAPPQQHLPSIAFGAQRFLAAWQEDRTDGATDVFIARLTSDESRMDGRGVRLSTNGDPGTKPRVVFDGTNFVIAWIETRNGIDSIVTNRMTPDGVLLDAGNVHQIFADSCIRDFDMGIDGAAPLIAWSDCSSGRVFASRITRGGIFAAVGFAQVSPNGVVASDASIAWNGKTFLIAWSDAIGIRAARLTPTMNLIDTAPITIANVVSRPSVASAGDDFLVTWQSSDRILARRVTSAAALDDPIDLGAGSHPAASHDGLRFFVAWESPQNDLVATHIGANDNVIIIATAFAEHNLALVPLNGGVAAAYERVADDKNFGGVYRVFLRTMMPASRIRAVAH
jgi:hypothetical protein